MLHKLAVGTSGCTHWVDFLDINCLHCLSQASGEQHFPKVTVGQLTSAASSPWRPSHASAGILHLQSFP